MITLKFTKKQSFTLSLENTFLKNTGGSNWPHPSFSGLKFTDLNNITYYINLKCAYMYISQTQKNIYYYPNSYGCGMSWSQITATFLFLWVNPASEKITHQQLYWWWNLNFVKIWVIKFEWMNKEFFSKLFEDTEYFLG